MHCGRDLHWQAGHCGATFAEAQLLAQEAAARAARAASEAAARAASEAAALAAPGGELDIFRTSAMTGAMYQVQLFVDGRLAGQINNGKSLRMKLPEGRRTIEARGGGLSRSVTVDVRVGATVRFKMYFSAFGILGGGLVLKPA